MSGAAVRADRARNLRDEQTPASAQQAPQQRPSDSTYVVYTVEKNTTAMKIAERFGIQYSDLIAENTWLRRTNGEVQAGQILHIPNIGSGSIHIVKDGDSLWKIAQAKGVELDDLIAANRHRVGRNGANIKPGQAIIIPNAVPLPRRRPELLNGPDSTVSGVRPPLARPMDNEGSVSVRRPATPPMPRPRPDRPEVAAPANSEVPASAETVQPYAPLDASKLSAGSFGNDTNPYRVRTLQRMLNRAGLSVTVDGDAGPETARAVRTFQERNSLAGGAGPKGSPINQATWDALVRASARPSEVPGVRFAVPNADLQDPKLASAYSMLSALAHDDPKRLQSMLQTDRAHDVNGDIIVDRATLQTFARHLESHGFAIKSSTRWTYDEARAVSDLLSGVFDHTSPEIGIDRTIKNNRYDAMITRIAREEAARAARNGEPLPAGFDFAAFIKAMMIIESNGNPNAGSGAGARGLMQLLPGTYRSMGGRGNILDPESNIRAGARYILEVQGYFTDGNPTERDGRTAGYYNSGPNAPASALTNYRESRRHARMVTSLYNLYRATGEPRG